MEKKYSQKTRSSESVKTTKQKLPKKPSRAARKGSMKIKETVTTMAEILKEELIHGVQVAKEALAATYHAAKDIFEDDIVPAVKEKQKAPKRIHTVKTSANPTKNSSQSKKTVATPTIKRRKTQEKQNQPK